MQKRSKAAVHSSNSCFILSLHPVRNPPPPQPFYISYRFRWSSLIKHRLLFCLFGPVLLALRVRACVPASQRCLGTCAHRCDVDFTTSSGWWTRGACRRSFRRGRYVREENDLVFVPLRVEACFSEYCCVSVVGCRRGRSVQWLPYGVAPARVRELGHTWNGRSRCFPRIWQELLVLYAILLCRV